MAREVAPDSERQKRLSFPKTRSALVRNELRASPPPGRRATIFPGAIRTEAMREVEYTEDPRADRLLLPSLVGLCGSL
jgi:hypothetical protein